MFEIRSDIYFCWHEAAHALTTYLEGGFVKSLVLHNPADPQNRPYAQCAYPNDPAAIRNIATAGNAIEQILFRNNFILLNGRPITEKEFIDKTCDIAGSDREKFFGKNNIDATGKWPKADDEAFLHHARQVVAPTLTKHLHKIDLLATELQKKGALVQAEIEAILLPL